MSAINPAPQYVVGNPEGLVEPGNININDRPIVQNGNDTSTVFATSIGTDKGSVLIPRVSDGADGKAPHIMSEAEARAYYKKTGQHLGVFKDDAAADDYSERILHVQQSMLGSRNGRTIMGLTPTTPLPPQNPMGGLQMGGGAPSIPPPPDPGVQVQQPAPNPQQQAQAASQTHDSLIGKTFKALTGQSTQYSVDPTTGKMIQTPVQNTPGQFFKNVVAAALLGGAMGEDKARQNEGSPLAAAVQGGTAVVNRNQQLDQQRIAQARDDYQDQLKAQQNQREQATADREAQEAPLRQDMLKAQTASYNMAVVRDTVEAHQKDFAYHQDVANAGKARAEAIYDSNGVTPFKTGLSETEAAPYVASNPGHASKYIAVATGTKTTLDKNGQPTWENTFSLYPNDATLPVSEAWLKVPEMQALKAKEPDYFAVLQKKADAHESLSPEVRTSIMSNANEAYKEQNTRNAVNLAAQKEQALIDEAKEHSKEYDAEIGKIYADRKDQEEAKGALAAVLTGDNGTYQKGSRIPPGAKIGDPIPVTNKQYAAALPVLNDNARSAHDNWIAAIDAAKNEDDPSGPLHKAVIDAGQTAAEAQGVVSGIVRRAGGTAGPGGASGLKVRYVDSDGTPYDLPAGQVAAFLQLHPNAKPGQPVASNPGEQVSVKLGSTVQTMSRADFAAQKRKWADIDPNVNPTAAAWKNATVTGAAPAPAAQPTFYTPPTSTLR